jgi:hypothetical protein
LHKYFLRLAGEEQAGPDKDLFLPVDILQKFWGEMGKLDDIFSGTKRFGVLSKLAKTLLVLPNSNADSERAFSIIKKISSGYNH